MYITSWCYMLRHHGMFILVLFFLIIIDYYMAFFIWHVISTRDAHISPGAAILKNPYYTPCNTAHIIIPHVIRIRLLYPWEIWLVAFRIYHICKIKHILSKYMISKFIDLFSIYVCFTILISCCQRLKLL